MYSYPRIILSYEGSKNYLSLTRSPRRFFRRYTCQLTGLRTSSTGTIMNSPEVVTTGFT